jgi:hypothetical protein
MVLKRESNELIVAARYQQVIVHRLSPFIMYQTHHRQGRVRVFRHGFAFYYGLYLTGLTKYFRDS